MKKEGTAGGKRDERKQEGMEKERGQMTEKKEMRKGQRLENKKMREEREGKVKEMN
jgi:hypothetical protein